MQGGAILCVFASRHDDAEMCRCLACATTCAGWNRMVGQRPHRANISYGFWRGIRGSEDQRTKAMRSDGCGTPKRPTQNL